MIADIFKTVVRLLGEKKLFKCVEAKRSPLSNGLFRILTYKDEFSIIKNCWEVV